MVIPISTAGRAPPYTRQRTCIPAQIPRTGMRTSLSHENSCTFPAKTLSCNAVPQRMIPPAPRISSPDMPGKMRLPPRKARPGRRSLLPGPRTRPGKGSRPSRRDPQEGSFCLQHGAPDAQDAPEIRVLFFRLQDHDLFMKDGSVEHKRLVLAAFTGEGDAVRPHVLL